MYSEYDFVEAEKSLETRALNDLPSPLIGTKDRSFHTGHRPAAPTRKSGGLALAQRGII